MLRLCASRSDPRTDLLFGEEIGEPEPLGLWRPGRGEAVAAERCTAPDGCLDGGSHASQSDQLWPKIVPQPC